MPNKWSLSVLGFLYKVWIILRVIFPVFFWHFVSSLGFSSLILDINAAIFPRSSASLRSLSARSCSMDLDALGFGCDVSFSLSLFLCFSYAWAEKVMFIYLYMCYKLYLWNTSTPCSNKSTPWLFLRIKFSVHVTKILTFVPIKRDVKANYA